MDSISNRCKYSCNDGYILRGDDETTCTLTDDGKQAIWDTTPPYCEPVCNHPEESEGGSYDCNGHEIGSVCQFSCDSEGSRLDGEPSLICKEDQFGKAYWAGQRATCIRKFNQKCERKCSGRALEIRINQLFSSMSPTSYSHAPNDSELHTRKRHRFIL